MYLNRPVCRIKWHLVVQIANTLLHPLKACRRTCVGHKTNEKHVRFSLEPVFSLSVLSYCRNMVVQHGSLCDRGPLQIRTAHSKVKKPTMILIFIKDYSLMKIYLIILYSVSGIFCQLILINLQNRTFVM